VPTRSTYLMDPRYVERCQRVFGVAPDKPRLELYIPEQFGTTDLLNGVYGPIWRLEYDVVWPLMAETLRRDGVSGDLVEFGVFGGGSFRRLIEIFRPLGIIDRFYGFDGFKGLPKPDTERDHPMFWDEGAFANTSRAAVEQYLIQSLGHLNDVELVEGWFSDTLPTMLERISRVAYARVDCDMYSSTVDVFAFLTGRLVDGSIIYFDDWTHDASTGETGAFFEFAEREAARYRFERMLTVSDGALAVRVRLAK